MSLAVAGAIWAPLVVALSGSTWWVAHALQATIRAQRQLARAEGRAWATAIARRAEVVASEVVVLGEVLIGPRTTLASMPATMVPVLSSFVAQQSGLRGAGVVDPAGRELWWFAGARPTPVAVPPTVHGALLVDHGAEVALAVRDPTSGRIDFLVEGLLRPGFLEEPTPALEGLKPTGVHVGSREPAPRGVVASTVASALGPVEVELRPTASLTTVLSTPTTLALAALVLALGVGAGVLWRFLFALQRSRAELAWRAQLEEVLADLGTVPRGPDDEELFVATAATMLSEVPGLRATPRGEAPWVAIEATDSTVRPWLEGSRARILRAIEREREDRALVWRLQRAEALARAASERDALTGVANRVALTRRLEELTSTREAEAVLCVLIDLDDFKEINDSLGHLAGDEVLVRSARRVRHVVEVAVEDALVARFGGDEFVVLVATPLDDDHAAQLARAIGRELRRSIDLTNGASVTVGVSIGWAWWPRDAADGADLVRAADVAMYEAKRAKARGEVPVVAAGARVLEDPWGPEADALLRADASWRSLLEGLVDARVLEAVEAGPGVLARVVADRGEPALADLEDFPLAGRVVLGRIGLAASVAAGRRRVLQARWDHARALLARRALSGVDEELSWLAAQPSIAGVAIVDLSLPTPRVVARAGAKAEQLASYLDARASSHHDLLEPPPAGDAHVVVRREATGTWALSVLLEVAADRELSELDVLAEAVMERIGLVRRGFHSRLSRREVLERLRNGGLRLALQPIVRLSDGEVVGLEALARLDDGHDGLLAPESFLPLLRPPELEELFVRVLEEAVGLAGRCLLPSIGISVNAPTVALRGVQTARDVEAVLKRYGVAPSRLTIELLEDVAGDEAGLAACLRALKRSGVHRALDDVGRAGQGLVRLARLPVDTVKVTSDVLDALDVSPVESIAALDALVRLAHAEHRVLVLEGIETELQLDVALALGVTLGQGFLLGRPEVGAPSLTSRTTDAAERPRTVAGLLAWHWRYREGHPGALADCPLTPSLPTGLAGLHGALHGSSAASAGSALTEAIVALLRRGRERRAGPGGESTSRRRELEHDGCPASGADR